MSEEKIARCPFCGVSNEWKNLESFDEHINACRIRRFNKACDAAIAGLLAGTNLNAEEQDIAYGCVRNARTLVEAIEKEQEK